MRLLILGPVVAEGIDGARLGGRRQCATLLALAVQAPNPVPVDRLAELVWTDPPPSATQTLRAYLSRLRDALTPTETRIVRELAGYRLAGADGLLDAAEFETMVRPLVNRPGIPADLTALERGLGLWRGPALDGYSDFPFARAVVDRLDDLRRRALRRRAQLALASGQSARLVVPLEEALARDPLDEELWGYLALALYRAQRQGDALAALRRARSVLRRELGVQPSAALVDLERDLLAQSPRLAKPANPPPAEQALALPRRSALPANRLPAPISSFVGRQAELAELGRLLAEHRLVTITGPGGAGKTRLALQALHEHPDPVLPLDLSGCESADDVARTLAGCVGLPNGRLAEVLERAVREVGTTPVLVLADNCERMVAPAAQVLAGLLGGCPSARGLATSRRALRVTGERLLHLHGFARPEEAVALFGDRAALLGRPVAAADTALVETICARLDHLPLAIELAAAALRGRSLAALAESLHRALDLLVSDDRAGPGQHRALRSTLRWSYQLLAPETQAVFRQLSVFAGGLDLDTAAAVAGLARPALAGQLQALAEHSLLGGPPYRMLATVRMFATELLDAAPDALAVRDRHARHFTDLALRAAGGARGSDAPAQLARLDASRADRRAALEHWLARGESEPALRLAGALLGYWETRYYFDYARSTCARALALAGGSAADRLAAMFTAARLALQDDDFAESETLGGELRRLADEAGNAQFSALSRVLLADLRRVHNASAAEIDGLLDEAEGYADRCAQRWPAAEVARVRLYVCWDHGELRAALRHGRRRLALLAEAGDRTGLAETHWELAGVVRDLDRPRLADRYYAASQQWFEAIDDPLNVGITVYARGRLAVLLGELEAAQALAERAHTLARRLGDRWLEAISLRSLGQIAARQSRHADAERLLGDSLAILAPRGFADDVAATILELAGVQLRTGRLDEANAHCERAMATQQGPPPGRWLGPLTSLAGRLALATGDVARSIELCRRGAELTEQYSARYLRADARAALAAAEAAGAELVNQGRC